MAPLFLLTIPYIPVTGFCSQLSPSQGVRDMARKYITEQAFSARFGKDAKCIGSNWTCPRPEDSDCISYCTGCPFRVDMSPDGDSQILHRGSKMELTNEQEQELLADFRRWSGGFEPNECPLTSGLDDLSVEAYIETSLPTSLPKRLAADFLRSYR